MKNLRLNYAAIAALTVWHQLQSMGWYTLFDEPWMRLSGLTMEQINSGSPAPYVVALITTAITVFSLAWLFRRMNIESGSEGVKTGAVIGLGCYFLIIITQDMFMMRSMQLSFINGGNYFLQFLIAGFVLGAWRKYEEPTKEAAVQAA